MTLTLHGTCHYNTWTSYLMTPGYYIAFQMSRTKSIINLFSGPRAPLLLTNEWFPGTYPYNEIFMSLEELSLWSGKIFAESTQSWSHPHLFLLTPMHIWINYRPMRTMVHASKASCCPWFSKLLVRKEGSSKWALEEWIMQLRSTSFHFVLTACGSNTKCLSSHTRMERKLPLFPVWTWTLTLSLHRYLLWVCLLYEAKCLTQIGNNNCSVLPPEPCCPPHGMTFRFWQAENIQI